MSGGGGSSSGNQAGGSAAPFAGAVQNAQSAFGPTLPFPNTGQAAQGAFNATQFAPSGANTDPYASQTLAQGFDPQNALYSKLFQQNQDQTRANSAASGVANTPYGAALNNQSNQDFNLNWQNQQLGRQSTAANTASTLGGLGNTQFQDLLQYIAGSGSNATEFLNAIQGLLGGAVNQASVTNTGAQQSNAANAASLGGLGSLLGGAGKLALAF